MAYIKPAKIRGVDLSMKKTFAEPEVFFSALDDGDVVLWTSIPDEDIDWNELWGS